MADLTNQVEEAMSVVFEAGRSVGTLHTLLIAMAEQIEANEIQIGVVKNLIMSHCVAHQAEDCIDGP